MPWPQNYAPLGSVPLSALVAALPVVTLLGLLAFWHVRAHFAALAALAVAAATAIGVYGMPPKLTATAAVYGAAFGFFPIGWIVLNAIFIYNLSVATGGFAVLQRQVAEVSRDRRIQALLIGFCFGAFIEGAAGFGSPIAITGALMIGLGFKPLEAAKLALIGNTAPVAFGALGIPLITLAKVTNMDLLTLSATTGRLLSPFAVVVPFWLVAAQCGWRGMLGVWPACLAAGSSFAATQFLVSNYHGPWLVSIAAALVSMVALTLLMCVWKPPGNQAPAKIATRAKEEGTAGKAASPEPQTPGTPAWRAWLPWVLLSVMVFLWGLPAVKGSLNALADPKFKVPSLHEGVLRVPPVVPKPEAEPAIFEFNALSATGTALLFAGLLAGLCLRRSPAQLLRLYGRTIHGLRAPLLTIAVMLALGFTTRYCGSDTTMGLALTATGPLFPFFSPLIGWLGVALTGSDTSSNVLFGNLQRVTARQLGLPPVLMAAANSSGGVMGKMIDAQSIVVASVVTGGHPESPDAGTVLRAVFWHSLALAALMGALVCLTAYCWPSLIPK